MFGYRCDRCGKGTVGTKTVHNYETRIDGVPFTVEAAVIGVCDRCESKYFSARETKRWRDAFYQERTGKGAILGAAEISELRKQMGLTVANLACLIGCSRQALYHWESPDRDAPQSRMADLMLRLVRESLYKGAFDVLEFLLERAKADEMEISDPTRRPSMNPETCSVETVKSPPRKGSGNSERFDLLFSEFRQPSDFSPRLRLVA